MVKTKLILIEGLPGSGKSTTAQLTNDFLKEMNLNTQLFLEGNVEHPADYDNVSYFTKEEFANLIATHKQYESLLSSIVIERKDGCLVPRYKLREQESILPIELLSTLGNYDIYELPLDLHIELLTEKWEQFRDHALCEDKTYIFDCSFIQNPVTIGMVKYGVSDEVVITYIKRLADIIKPLNPILIYVDQKDLQKSFKKAVKERPKEWSEGFMNYYNNQGYGKKHSVEGLEGTLSVLHARKELETKIYDVLEMKKYKMDNSHFEMEGYKSRINHTLKNNFDFVKEKL